MAKTRYSLPMIVCGEIVRPEDVEANDIQVFEYETGVEIAMPKLKPEHVDRILKSDVRPLHDLSIGDIVRFLDKAAGNWLTPGYPLAEQLIQRASAVTGLSEEMIRTDLEYVAYSARTAELFEVIEMDLENAYYLDEFIAYKASYRHAQPRGKVLHVVVGNVQMAGLYTLIRSIVTKNNTIAKLPRRDPVTVLMFALGFLDVAKDHPVSRSITVGYWDVEGELGRRLVNAADAVCVWGQRDTMESIRRLAPYGTKILEFGPKRSLAVIAKGADVEEAAMRLAYDISIYDQEACFSPQQVLYQGGDLDPFLEALAYYLDVNLRRIPRKYVPRDVAAHVNFTRLEAQFMGRRLIHRGGEWHIIVHDDVSIPAEHPLGRTIFVHPIQDLEEVAKVVDGDVQTVSLYPASAFPAIAEELTYRGCTRIVEMGLAGKPRLGIAHDGLKPLSELVRWVTVERGTNFGYKYLSLPEAGLCEYLFGQKRTSTPEASRPGPNAAVASHGGAGRG